MEWYTQNVLEQHKFSNVNCITLLDESCHFSKTRTIKITGFQLEDLGLMVLYRMHMTRGFKDLSRKRTIISYFHHPLRSIFEILPTFSHVWKHFISSIVTLMMSCWGSQSYVFVIISSPKVMRCVLPQTYCDAVDRVLL